MNINQLEPKIAGTIVAQSIRNSDTLVQMNINQLEPKTADTSRAKYQKF